MDDWRHIPATGTLFTWTEIFALGLLVAVFSPRAIGASAIALKLLGWIALTVGIISMVAAVWLLVKARIGA